MLENEDIRQRGTDIVILIRLSIEQSKSKSNLTLRIRPETKNRYLALDRLDYL